MTMGDLYFSGDKVKQDIKKARDYYSKALELGRTAAYCKLGLTYLIENKKNKAIEYYKKGAETGDALAVYMYSPYVGNFSEEIKMLRYAYSQGLCFSVVYSTDPTAPYYIYRCDMKGESVEVKSQNPKCPSDREVGEAYVVKYGKRLGLSVYESAQYKRLN